MEKSGMTREECVKLCEKLGLPYYDSLPMDQILTYITAAPQCFNSQGFKSSIKDFVGNQTQTATQGGGNIEKRNIERQKKKIHSLHPYYLPLEIWSYVLRFLTTKEVLLYYCPLSKLFQNEGRQSITTMKFRTLKLSERNKGEIIRIISGHLPNLQHLTFYYNLRSEFDDVVQTFQNLRSLKAPRCYLTDPRTYQLTNLHTLHGMITERVTELTNLTSIHYAYCVHAPNFSALTNLVRLTHPIVGTGEPRGLVSLTKLTRLTVCDLQVNPDVSKMTHLLDIHTTNTTPSQDINQLVKLHTLRLASEASADFDISAHTILGSLTRLVLQNFYYSMRGPISGLSHLRRLTLSNMCLRSYAGRNEFTALTRLERLETVGATDEDLCAIICQMKNITDLTLCGTITDGKEIANLISSLKRLRVLRLPGKYQREQVKDELGSKVRLEFFSKKIFNKDY